MIEQLPLFGQPEFGQPERQTDPVTEVPTNSSRRDTYDPNRQPSEAAVDQGWGLPYSEAANRTDPSNTHIVALDRAKQFIAEARRILDDRRIGRE